MNMKENKLTVVGTVDPISVVTKLRKFWRTTDIVLVGPAKEPEKKEEAKKEEGKKDEAKKEDGKKDEAKKEDGKKDEPKKKEDGKEEEKKKAVAPPQVAPGMFMPYRPYYNPINTHYNYQQYQPYPSYQHNYQPRYHSIEENPNACVMC